MGVSPSLSPWATLRFRRARDVRGWALLGIPEPLYPRVMQRLFEQQAKFIKKHHQGDFVSILFEAPGDLAARLALTFPAPTGADVLVVDASEECVLEGQASNHRRVRRQAKAQGPSLSELAQQEVFWEVVLAQVEVDNRFDPMACSQSERSATNQLRKGLGTDEQSFNMTTSESQDRGSVLDEDDEGWEDDDFAAEGEDGAAASAVEPSEDFEDIWVESEEGWVEPESVSEPGTDLGFPTEVLLPFEPVLPLEAIVLADADAALRSPATSPREPHPIQETPTVVRQEPFPSVISAESGLSPDHSITPTAVGKVLGTLTIEEAIAQEQERPQVSLPPPILLTPGGESVVSNQPHRSQATDGSSGEARLEVATASVAPAANDEQTWILQGDAFQIDLLLYEGVEAWNHWRAHYPDLRPNLRGAYLNHLDLRWADLHEADLRFAFLFYADLAEADLYGAWLEGADLIHANLEAADLRYASLPRTYLSYANLSHADLREADLQQTFLYGANLAGAFLPKNL